MNHTSKPSEAEMQDLARDAMRPDSFCLEDNQAQVEHALEMRELALAAKLENEACAALGVF
jgi:hypothetical protein